MWALHRLCFGVLGSLLLPSCVTRGKGPPLWASSASRDERICTQCDGNDASSYTSGEWRLHAVAAQAMIATPLTRAAARRGVGNGHHSTAQAFPSGIAPSCVYESSFHPHDYLWGSYWYPHFTDEETGPERLRSLLVPPPYQLPPAPRILPSWHPSVCPTPGSGLLS